MESKGLNTDAASVRRRRTVHAFARSKIGQNTDPSVENNSAIMEQSIDTLADDDYLYCTLRRNRYSHIYSTVSSKGLMGGGGTGSGSASSRSMTLLKICVASSM